MFEPAAVAAPPAAAAPTPAAAGPRRKAPPLMLLCASAMGDAASSEGRPKQDPYIIYRHFAEVPTCEKGGCKSPEEIWGYGAR